MAGSKQATPTGTNGENWTRSMGAPVLFDSTGTKLNVGVPGIWTTLFDLKPWGDRIFIGLEIYNPNASNPIYLAFEQNLGSEVRALIVEPSSTLALDELSFGGVTDPVTQKALRYVRAMCPNAVGVPAKGTATWAANIANNTAFDLGSNMYTILDSPFLAPVANSVLVQRGATLAATLVNIAAAINAADTNVTATSTGTTVVVTSNWSGLGMNGYVFVDVSSGSSSFTGSGTLGGAGATQVGTAGITVDTQIW